MSIHSEVGFGTGPVTVTRASASSDWDKGRFVRGTPTTFTLTDATVYPGSGRTEQDQPQGQETTETLQLNTDVQLFAATPTPPNGGDTGVGREADLVTFASGPYVGTWVVTSVKYFGVISGHYSATIERLYVGEAS